MNRLHGTLLCLLLFAAMSGPAKSGWFAGRPPTDLGVRDGARLKPCPDRPNCVNSQEPGASSVAPLTFAGEPAAAWQRLEVALRTLPRMVIVERREGYLRAEAVSRMFGFVDDVEFVLEPASKAIHVRSASRLGYSDLGANRDRIELIRRAFDQPAG